MSKVHFFYSVMNAGKTTALLQTVHNYRSNDWNVITIVPNIDTRNGEGIIKSRIGMEIKADLVLTGESSLDLTVIVGLIKVNVKNTVVIVDESQFVSRHMIELLFKTVDFYEIPLLLYGLKNNSNGELFNDTISYIIANSDQLKEIKTLCYCGKKATHILKYDPVTQDKIISGEVVDLGAEDKYVSVCRVHWDNYHMAVHKATKVQK